MRFWAFAAVAGVTLLAACQTTTEQGYELLHANEDPLTIAGHVADEIGACWFKNNDKTFAGYSYAPELSSTERPRVLLVDKAKPDGLPQLVVEVIRAKHGSDIHLFGPLMNGSKARLIRRDVAFWAGGGRTCR